METATRRRVSPQVTFAVEAYRKLLLAQDREEMANKLLSMEIDKLVGSDHDSFIAITMEMDAKRNKEGR